VDNVVQVAEVRFGGALTWLLECVGVCAERAGRPYTPGVLAGLFGHAFESTYAARGGEVWSGCCFEWCHHARGYRRLGLACEAVDLIGNNPSLRPRPTPEERAEALQRAWELVHASVARGVPALAWNPMSLAQRDGGLNAFTWGLLEGCDEATREYLVCHPAAGRFRTPFDKLGQVDPVQYLHIATFSGPDPAYSAERATREAISDALATLRGEVAGADMPSPPKTLKHGVGAFYEWAGDVETGRVKSPASRSGWWSRARTGAAEFCAWATPSLPSSQAPLDAARSAFERQAAEFRSIADGDATSDRIRRIARLQDEAIAALAAAG